MKLIRCRCVLWSALGVLAAMVVAEPAGATTYFPTRFDDPKPGKCKPDDCSLREALKAANDTDAGHDVVILRKGTYELQLPYGGIGTYYESSDFDIWTGITVRGQGPSKTTVDGNAVDRVFEFGQGIAPTGKAKLADLTITGGNSGAAGGLHTNTGGGIYVSDQPLTLDHVVIKGNIASLGGGIQNHSTRLEIENSTITRNSAAEGGGIHAPSDGVTYLDESTVSDNTATKGGGVLADGSPGFGPTPPIFLGSNSTVAGNAASADGGGVISDNGASVIFSNSTIAYNTANVDNIGSASGGGVMQRGGAFFNLYDSIVASNDVGTNGTDAACSGTFAGDGNVVTAAAGCASLSPNTNQSVGSALIGPLSDNGGPTKTIKLRHLSPAIGYAQKNCPKTDQRGVERPDDCDSGSFERKKP